MASDRPVCAVVLAALGQRRARLALGPLDPRESLPNNVGEKEKPGELRHSERRCEPERPKAPERRYRSFRPVRGGKRRDRDAMLLPVAANGPSLLALRVLEPFLEPGRPSLCFSFSHGRNSPSADAFSVEKPGSFSHRRKVGFLG